MFSATRFFAGKLYANSIWAITLVGSLLLHGLVNLMSPAGGIGVFQTVSICFYCMLPIILFSAINIIFDMTGKIGLAVAILMMLWCTAMATRFVEVVAKMQ